MAGLVHVQHIDARSGSAPVDEASEYMDCTHVEQWDGSRLLTSTVRVEARRMPRQVHVLVVRKYCSICRLSGETLNLPNGLEG